MLGAIGSHYLKTTRSLAWLIGLSGTGLTRQGAARGKYFRAIGWENIGERAAAREAARMATLLFDRRSIIFLF